MLAFYTASTEQQSSEILPYYCVARAQRGGETGERGGTVGTERDCGSGGGSCH